MRSNSRFGVSNTRARKLPTSQSYQDLSGQRRFDRRCDAGFLKPRGQTGLIEHTLSEIEGDFNTVVDRVLRKDPAKSLQTTFEFRDIQGREDYQPAGEKSALLLCGPAISQNERIPIDNSAWSRTV